MNIDKQALREVAEKALPAMQRLLMMPNDELFDEAVLNVDGDVDAANAFNLSFGPETALALLDELECQQTFQQAFFRQSLMYDVVAEAYEEAKEQIAKDVEIKARLCRESNSLHDRLRAAERSIAEQIAIVAAAEKLVRCKGRYHSELNYRALAKLFGITTPDLPSLEHENVHYADAAEMEIVALRQRIAELEAREIKPAKGEVLVVVSGFTGCGKSAIAGEIEIAMKAIGVPVQWTNGDAEKHMTGADWLTAIEMYKPTVRIVEVNVPRAADIKVKE
ncbi:ead/Ea22-like family protein [Salmonella enterica subsp. enterica serovar Richmond]|nr:ead/Ea22-like family protein [Salmonella enterica subsp. enterica serovar Richmond]ECD3843102.1 ead/Ea22-like family protein [Salmonella enterica subsp. enterica serovar Richmond]EEH5602496.1 ead/Ea22-like family protein [Salmonella enterica subsp. enterica serovar Richmond]EJJ7789678.1 ead/Ea22-like family protein [Salmonella enterica]